MKTCIIVDDEQDCVDMLAAMIRAKFSDKVTIVGTLTDSRKVGTLISETNPNIVFIDVEMPHVSGIQLMHSFPEKKFSVVFTTAYDKYALEALRTGATDYLLKPISMDELGEAIDKILQRSENNSFTQLQSQKILLPTTKGSMVVNINDIIRIESNSNYCCFYIVNKPKTVVAKTLKEYEEMLTGSHFFRVHQSHLVNLNYVEYFHPGAEEYVILTNGEQIEVSRRRKAEFLQRLSSL